MTTTLSSLIGRSLLAPLRRLARDESAVTAIEVGLLAAPFFAIIGAILETSMVFLAGQVLDSAVNDASRQIRTGQAKAFTLAQFETLVCNKLFGLFSDCHALQVLVTPVNNFTDATVEPPLSANCTPNCTWNWTEKYEPGSGSSTMIVQVYYRWPLILPMASFAPNDQPDGTRLLGSVQVFRNEPFASGGSAPPQPSS